MALGSDYIYHLLLAKRIYLVAVLVVVVVPHMFVAVVVVGMVL
jgi:hypothetical protein